MVRYNGGVPVTGYISPTDTTDTYATHHDNLGKGGVHSFSTEEERNNIRVDRRSEGMLCYVKSTGLTYQLLGGLENTNWVVAFTSENDKGDFVTKQFLWDLMHDRVKTIWQVSSQ